MDAYAVITGAGSGVGRAVALKLHAAGWNIALVGRRPDPLDQTAQRAGSQPPNILAIPCDIADPAQVDRMAGLVQGRGPVEVLVNAAGTNLPRRSLRELTLEGYRQVVEANLTGSYLCAQAFLPAMRQRRSGTIINIVSDAGLRANAKAGVAYVVSKFGQAGLTQSINEEERANGIRACAIFPGDINTPILDKRPAPPPPEARLNMLQPEDIAECVMLAINLPPRAIVEQLVVRPR